MPSLAQSKLLQLHSSELNWSFDFSPIKVWSSFLPVVALRHENLLTILAGFNRKETSSPLWVLEVTGALEDILSSLYPAETLCTFETLRLNKISGRMGPQVNYLSDLNIELQNFFDHRQVSLKILKPLEHLKDWINPITETFLELKPSNSQIRELLDILCDLKFLDLSWVDCAPNGSDAHQWLLHLNKKRRPLSSSSDERASQLVGKIPWPRGVEAKWERQGDRGGIHIQTHISHPRDFQNLKNFLSQVHLEENLWNP